MSDDPARPKVSLELLMANVERVLDVQRATNGKLDRIIEDVGDIKFRMTNVEEALAGVNRRIDRMEVRLNKIEVRLGLIDASD